MRTQIHTPIFNKRSKYRILRILTMFTKLVPSMRKIQKLEDSQRDPRSPYTPQWGILVVHHMLCEKFIRFEAGVEFIPMDMEEIPGFLEIYTQSSMVHGQELDWGQGDNLQACHGIQSTSTLDCRYYVEEVVLQEADQSMEPSGRLLSPHAHSADVWSQRESDQLSSQVFFKEGRMGAEQAAILGWTDAITNVSLEQLFAGQEQDLEIERLQAAKDEIWFPNVL